MSDEHESLKRVLLSIKGAARGFKTDKMKSRLAMKPEAELDAVANPMDAAPNPLAEGSEGEEAMEPPMEAAAEGDNDAAAKLEAIRRLIGSV